MDHQVKVSILGHSFIRRLERFIDNVDGYKNLRLSQDKFSVDFRAKGGLTVNKLVKQQNLLTFNAMPHLIFIQIGGNDACDIQRSAPTIAQDIVSFALYFCHGLGIKIVIIGQLLPRYENRTFQGYNDKIMCINKLITEKLHNLSEPRILFWHHHGFWSDINFLSFDGVHLNHQGMLKYFRSIRSAILHASKKLIGK